MVPGELLQGDLLLDGPRCLLRLELLVNVHLSFHISEALEREAVTPKMDLRERVAVLNVPGSLSLKPGFQHWRKFFFQSVLRKADLCDLVLPCECFEESHSSRIPDFIAIELETGEEWTSSA